MLAGDEFYDDDVTSGWIVPPPVYCRNCAHHYRGECPEGWPPSEQSPIRPPDDVPLVGEKGAA